MLRKIILAATTFLLVACATPAVTEPVSYCSLTRFLVMKPETAKWLAHNDEGLAQGIRLHNATWLAQCRK